MFAISFRSFPPSQVSPRDATTLARMPSSPLRDFTRSRVLGALERLSVPNAPTALLLDDVTRRILSSTCRMSELMEAGQLTLVDNIHTRPSERSTEGYMHVIYLVSPTAESIDAVIADYQEVAVYGGRCHILLSCRLPAERLEQLRGCPLLMHHVHTLRELNVPFISLQVCASPVGPLSLLPRRTPCPLGPSAPPVPLYPWAPLPSGGRTAPALPAARRRLLAAYHPHRPRIPAHLSALQAWRRGGTAEESASGCAFSLDAPRALATLYGAGPEAERASLLTKLAGQTAALCAALG